VACVHCDRNINLQGRNRRLRAGAIIYTFGLGFGVWAAQPSIPTLLRAFAFVPFLVGGLMVFQSIFKTCVLRALRGERETDLGVERVVHAGQLRDDRARAWRVIGTSAITACLATGGLLLLP
jgi:hypothetical protein